MANAVFKRHSSSRVIHDTLPCFKKACNDEGLSVRLLIDVILTGGYFSSIRCCILVVLFVEDCEMSLGNFRLKNFVSSTYVESVLTWMQVSNV